MGLCLSHSPGSFAAQVAHGPPIWSSVPLGELLLVDAAPLIYHLENNAQFAPRFAGLFEAASQGDLRIAVSAIALAEVLTGPYAKKREALARKTLLALREFEIIPMTEAIAVEAARLRARYRLRLPDAVQLATALEIKAWALVTHDRDFSKVQDIQVWM
jgi:predicted nucleic acid-binding protein